MIYMLQDTNKLLDNRMKNVNSMLEEEKKHSLKKQQEVSNLFVIESLISLGIHKEEQCPKSCWSYFYCILRSNSLMFTQFIYIIVIILILQSAFVL